MRWSQIRKRIKELIVSDLRNRIDVCSTGYHNAHDGEGEAWITIDKIKVCGGGYYHWFSMRPDERTADKNVAAGTHPGFYTVATESEDVKLLQASGIHRRDHITKSLFNYLNTPFEQALSSSNPFFRAFAIVDRRLGKRRFLELTVGAEEHELIRRFYDLRKSSSNAPQTPNTPRRN